MIVQYKGCASMQSNPRPFGGGIFIALGVFAGIIGGLWSGKPSLGLAIGLGTGLALAVAVSVWDHRRRR